MFRVYFTLVEIGYTTLQDKFNKLIKLLKPMLTVSVSSYTQNIDAFDYIDNDPI